MVLKKIFWMKKFSKFGTVQDGCHCLLASMSTPLLAFSGLLSWPSFPPPDLASFVKTYNSRTERAHLLIDGRSRLRITGTERRMTSAEAVKGTSSFQKGERQLPCHTGSNRACNCQPLPSLGSECFIWFSTHFFCDFPAPDSRKPLAKGLWSILSWVTFSFW